MPKNAKTKKNGRELQAPKGMHDLIGSKYYDYQGFFEKAAEIAVYYGFSPIETPILEQENLFTDAVGEPTDIVEKEMYTLKTKGGDRLALRPEGTAPIMRAYFENGLQAEPQPLMLYYSGPFFRHDKPQQGRLRQFHQFGLEIIGTGKSIADALIIKLALLILNEAGLDNLKLEVNSIGCRECRPNFRRDLVSYYRKHIRQICPACRGRLKTNPLRLLDCRQEQCREIKKGGPAALSYLCAACKAHFHEFLEYLEMIGVRYEVNNNLVRGLNYYSRTVFEIFETGPGPDEGPPLALASGGRYDGLAKDLGYRKEVPAVGVALGIDRVITSAHYLKLTPRLVKKPKVFFIQLSFDAKLKSFAIIEILRKAKIPIAQSLPKDSLATQLAIAEKQKVPYALILGQKEALEESVIVRNMATSSQETVRIQKLAEHLKYLKNPQP